MKRAAVVLFSLCAIAGIAGTASAECKPAFLANCSLEEVVGALIATTPDATKAAIRRAVAKDFMAPLTEELQSMPTPSPAPAGTLQTHASREDFNVRLNVGISSFEQSEDGQSLIVRFNPIRQPAFSAGLTGTVTKGSAAGGITDAIGADEGAKVAKHIDDFDDLALSLSVTGGRGECTVADLKSRWCIGRNVATYSAALSEILAHTLGRIANGSLSAAAVASPVNKFQARAGLILNEVSIDGFATTWGQVAESDRRKLYALFNRVVAIDRADSLRIAAETESLGFNRLDSLIDNQPQWALTATRTARNELVGGNRTTVGVELQFGIDNLNTRFGGCENDCAESLLAPIRTGKWVFNASYVRNDTWRVDSLPATASAFTPILVPWSSAITAKAQYGAELRAKVSGRRARFDANVQYARRNNAGVLAPNRVTGTATLTVPLSDDLSLPVSLNYANEPELVGDVAKRLGMHFGLSYRLPFN